MAAAIAEARRAEAEGEVPVGAVAVADGQSSVRDTTGRSGSSTLPRTRKSWQSARPLRPQNLPADDAVSIDVTLELCVMCVGAMLNARIARVVYGARDDKAGALGSVYDIGRDGRLNHRFEVVGGVMESECAELMREFFRSRRGGA